MKDNPIFIVGVQRSGTTLLRLILNAHSEIAIPEEARFLTPILKNGCIDKHYSGHELDNLIQYLRNNSQFALWNFNSKPFFDILEKKNSISVKELIELMFGSYGQYEGKPIWGDKSLFFGSIDVLHELFPNARFIHIVRDGRDVFNSWRQMDDTKDNSAVMALDWSFKEKSIKNSFVRISNNKQFTIRYEDLLQQPEKYVKLLCSFLEVPYQHSMLEFYKSSQRYIGEHHSALIFRKIDKQNIQKWKSKLSNRDTVIFTSLARSLLAEYRYETKGIKLSFSNSLLLLSKLAVGLPSRVLNIISNRAKYAKALKEGTDVNGLTVGEMPKEKQGRETKRDSNR